MKTKLANAKPFLFDTSFDEPTTVKLSIENNIMDINEKTKGEIEKNIPDTPPPPTFSIEDMEDAKREAFNNGYKNGVDTTNAENDSKILDIMQLITAKLAILEDKQQSVNEANSALLAQITGKILTKLMPSYVNNNGGDEIVFFLQTCISHIVDNDKIIIHVANDVRDNLEYKLSQICENAGFEGRIIIIGKDNMGSSDINIDWQNGNAERDWDKIWDKINIAIKDASDLINKKNSEFNDGNFNNNQTKDKDDLDNPN